MQTQKFTGGYCYGFNGQSKDDEVAGSGNSYTAEFWQYDSRLGRRWNVDPMFKKSCQISPYSAFYNNPLIFSDKRGLEGNDEHIVSQGESPWSISKSYGISLDKLASMNPDIFKNYSQESDKYSYWKNSKKNWIINPGDKLKIAEPIVQGNEKMLVVGRSNIDKEGDEPTSGYQGMARLEMTVELDPNSPNYNNMAVIQSVIQNDRKSSEGCEVYGPLQKQSHLDFVWGPGGLNKCDEIVFQDEPGRCTNPNGVVTFYATTSVVIITDNKLEILYTFQYGFSLNPDGTGTTMPARPYSKEEALKENNPHFFWLDNVYGHLTKGMNLDFENLNIGF